MRCHWKSLIASVISFFAVTVFVLSICLPCQGQTGDATLGGVIEDRSGAVIPHVTVKITSAETGATRNATTNGSGVFNVPGLNPGKYSVHVEHPGFADVEVKDITLNVGSNRQLEIKLPVGGSEQSVTVDGSGLAINTTDGSVSTVIDRQFVANIPLNGRSFQDLILLTPGVTTNSPQSAGDSGATGEFSVNGQRTESNVYTVDGVSANTGGYIYGYGTPGTSGSLPAATALGTTQSLVSVDALQEFRVESSSYSAEYGLSPGGQFSFATRPGTNEIHGTAFDYLRNNYFDANNWFNDYLDEPTTAERQNDFGGTLGGPIWIPKLYNGKNKTFFFVSYEGLRLTQPTAATILYVPTMTLRHSAPAALQPAMNAFPVPTGAEVTVACDGVTYLCPTGQPVGTEVPSGLAQFIEPYSLPSKIDSTSFRIDEQITPKYKVFYRFGYTPSSTETRNLSVSSSTLQSSSTNTLGLTATLSDRVVDDFRLNYTSNRGSETDALDNFGGAQPVNLLQLQGLQGATAYAEIGIYPPGLSAFLDDARTIQPQHSWDIVDSVTFAYGHQTFKAGFDRRETASRLQYLSPYVYSLFNSEQGILDNNSYESGAYVYGRSYPAYTNTALYLQDEMRLNQRLTLSLGVRWEVNPPPTQTSGQLPYFAEGNINDPSTLSLAPANTRFWKTTYFNFAPRLGIAYQAHNQPGLETVIRAGGGVFFDSGQQNSTQAFGFSPGQSANAYYSNVSYPLTPTQVNLTIANPPVAPYNATANYFPDRLQLPYTLQWNLSVEQALGKYQTFTLSYVGSNGRRLFYQNYVTPATGDFSYDGLYIEGTGITSSYNALQVKFQRSLSRNLQVLASYNWSHAIDFGSQNLAYIPQRGSADYDVRHNFNLAATYEFPRVNTGRMLKELINQWALDGRFVARTAFPVTLEGNYLADETYNGYSNLNIVPGVPVYLHASGIPGNREINPAAFSLPSGNDFGDAPRNFVRGFGEVQLDTAVHRTFPIHEQLNLQFRAEAFNILNHPNFGYIDALYGGPQFGQATKTLNESLGNLSPLYQQGGPRSMQFALKLQF